MTITSITSILTAVGILLSGFATTLAIIISYKVYQNQKLLSQRQLLLPLWDYMSTLQKVDPQNPISPEIIKVVNTLELVAICCEGGMIDVNVIMRTFKDQFMMHYEDIKKCKTIPGTNLDGEELLKQNRSAAEFYKSLEQYRLSEDRIKRV
jgi:hypothetical protein